uniref:Protein kinase domain-containing protein n=1 Tax=Kalanchoe fedtschenkoi TaxID=63787 RepID=A0A7N0V9E3_KALFE
MGCVQAKSSSSSPPQGLEKLKLEVGYVGRKESEIRSGVSRSGSDESLEKVVDEMVGKSVAAKQAAMQIAEDGDGGGDEVVDGWPKWLTDNIPADVLSGLVPKSAESYDMISKIGSGTYSNVYKARDRESGKVVALKKVRFDTSEPEAVKFMAREIMILQKLDHPNIVKLQGLATSRMHYSLYLVFDFMQTDLAHIISRPDTSLTEPQIKSYAHQLLSGLQHCHEKGILHRDVKGSNLLIDRNGALKIADFGLANYFEPNKKQNLTSRVVTLWYRAPELLLGATDYGVGIDLWSAGCLVAEMFEGVPIMPGRTEVEQIHKIFKLCGTPSEEYWKRLRLSSTFRPPHSYKPNLQSAFRTLPGSAIDLLSTLLAWDPAHRGTAASALQNPDPEEMKNEIVIQESDESRKSSVTYPNAEEDNFPQFLSPIKTPNHMPLARDTITSIPPPMPARKPRNNDFKDIHSRHTLDQASSAQLMSFTDGDAAQNSM